MWVAWINEEISNGRREDRHFDVFDRSSIDATILEYEQ